jgi:hypothetical protein
MDKLPLKGGLKKGCAVSCSLLSLAFIVALHSYIRKPTPKCCIAFAETGGEAQELAAAGRLSEGILEKERTMRGLERGTIFWAFPGKPLANI